MKIVAPLGINKSSTPSVSPYVPGSEVENPAPNNPSPNPTDPLDPGIGFGAYLVQAPADGASLSGTVTIQIAGRSIYNAELLPEFGYSPIYGTFTIAADRKSASLSFDTTTLTDRSQKFRVSAFDVPPNTSGATELVVFTRTWTINNGNSQTPGVDPSTIIVDYYGGSTVTGYNGGQQPPAYVANTYPQQLQDAYPGITVRNEGVNSMGLQNLIEGSDGVHPPWTTQLSLTNATHVISAHGINDWIATNDFKNLLTTWVNAARNAGKIPILQTLTPTYLSLQGGSTASDAAIDERAQAIREIATALNVPLIDTHQYLIDYMAANSMTRQQLTPDGLHMDTNGFAIAGPVVVERMGQITGLTGGGGVVNPNPSPNPTPTPVNGLMRGPAEADFYMTFFDDFDGSALSDKWADGLWYNRGVPSGTLRVAGGELQLTGNPATMFTGADETGYCCITTDPGSMSSGRPGFIQRYGVWQIECKMPAGKGYWPAFWVFGHPGNNRPEIDVFEAYPGGQWDWTWPGNTATPTTIPRRPQRADVSVHCKVDNGGLQNIYPVQNNNLINGPDLSAAFHTYTVEWDRNFMRFYVDGNLSYTVTNADVLTWFSQFQLYTILQLSINYGVSGGPSSDPAITPYGFSSDPANPGDGVMRIKYCAAWQYTKYRP